MLHLAFVSSKCFFHDLRVDLWWNYGSILVRYPPPDTLGTRSWSSEAADHKKFNFRRIFGPCWGPSWVLLESFWGFCDIRVAAFCKLFLEPLRRGSKTRLESKSLRKVMFWGWPGCVENIANIVWIYYQNVFFMMPSQDTLRNSILTIFDGLGVHVGTFCTSIWMSGGNCFRQCLCC